VDDWLTPRSRICANITWARLYDAMGELYARDRYDDARARRANELATALTRAMHAELARASWLDAATRTEAERKLANIAWQVGVPSQWKRYDLALDRKAFASNLLALTKLQASRESATVGAPRDRTPEFFTVSAANAQYRRELNGIQIPAGILQAPLFDPAAPPAINFGSIGMVIGHELTHAFDDQGAKFDTDGSQRDWWNPATYAEFAGRTKCVIDQFDHYTTQAGNVNGALTVGENIADVGGLKLAFAAYHESRTATTRTTGSAFTNDQEFFLSFAQTFCRKARPDWARWALAHDPHAPSDWRVNATVSAMPEFAAAFSCKAGARLAPVTRCSVW
jgi:predicted metalloendopeptidase